VDFEHRSARQRVRIVRREREMREGRNNSAYPIYFDTTTNLRTTTACLGVCLTEEKYFEKINKPFFGALLFFVDSPTWHAYDGIKKPLFSLINKKTLGASSCFLSATHTPPVMLCDGCTAVLLILLLLLLLLLILLVVVPI